VDPLLLGAGVHELFLLLCVVVLTVNGVEVVCLPVLEGGFGPLNLLVDLQLLIMQLQVSIRNDIVIAEPCCSCLFYFLFL